MTSTTPPCCSNREDDLAPAQTEHAGDPCLKYRDLFNYVNEGFAYCQMIFDDGEGHDFVYLAVNRAFETLTGLTNVIGKRVTEVIPGIRESDPELLQRYARVARTAVPEKFEIYVKALRQWLSISVYSPEREFFVAVFDVITQRKQAEKSLQDSEADLRALFDDASLPYHEIDCNGIVVRVNRAECEALGLKATEMVGRPIWDFVCPEEREPCRAAVMGTLLGTSAPPRERKFLSRTGAELIFQLYYRPIQDAAGNVVGVRTTMIDRTETSQLNARLALERQLLHALMDQTPDHIYFKDTEGCFILVNAAQARVLGFSEPAKVVGRSDFDFFSPAHAEPTFRDEQDLIEERVPRISKVERETWPDGHESWVHTTKVPLRDPAGKITGTFGISRDITEDRRLEAAVRASEERLAMAKEALGLGTWDLDLATGQAKWTRKLLQLYGQPEDRQDIAEWAHSVQLDDCDSVRADLAVMARTGKPISRRSRIVWPDGSVRWLHSITSAIRDNQNKVVRLGGICFDVTELAQTEERLSVLSTAVEQSPVSIVITDLQGNIEYANPKTTELTGYALDELIGQNPRVLKSGHTPPAEYENLWRTIQTGEWHGTFHNRRKNGDLFWEEATIRPIRDSAGAPTHFLEVKEDITARKLAEDKIAWLASFSEQSPLMIVEVEVPDGTIHYANPAARRLFPDLEQRGLAHAWLAGLELMPERLTSVNGSELGRDVMVGDRCYSQTVHYLPTERRLRVYGKDITKRKQTESALRRSESKFRALYNSTSDAVMLLDDKGFFDCNDAALTMFGCATRQDFCSLHPADLSPREQPGGVDSRTLAGRHIAAAMENCSDHFEWMHKRLDTGETFPADVLLNALELDGRMVAQAVVRDITRRKQAENALRESELKYRTLLKHIPQRIIYKDRESVYVSCNDLFAEDLGVPAADVVGKTDFDFYPSELAEKYRADDRRIMDLGRTVELEEDNIAHGKPCTVLTLKTPVVSEQGAVIGVLGVFTDITERKRAEAALRENERQLRLAQKLESIGQLAAGVAHEINTPIQYIGDNGKFLEEAFRDLSRVVELGHASGETTCQDARRQALEQGIDVDYLNEEIPKAIEQLLQGVDNVARIVRALKEFSHPGPQEKRPTNINATIGSTIIVCRNEWKYVADLTTDFDADLPLVPCLAGELNQVMLNLIVNAAHAIGDVVKDSGGKGAIRIGTRRNGDYAEIRVSDTGGGIPEDIRSRVFDPFFTTKAVGKGTGQGLAIAHNVIVQKHRGTIAIESESGKGTTFVIRLPLEERPAE